MEYYYRMYLIRKREEAGLSINKLTSLINIQRQQYYRIEKGIAYKKVTFILMCKIAKVLGMTADEMFYLEMRYQDERRYDVIKKGKK